MGWSILTRTIGTKGSGRMKSKREKGSKSKVETVMKDSSKMGSNIPTWHYLPTQMEIDIQDPSSRTTSKAKAPTLGPTGINTWVNLRVDSAKEKGR